MGCAQKKGKKDGNGNVPEPAMKSLGEKAKGAQLTKSEKKLLMKRVMSDEGLGELVRDALVPNIQKIVKSKPTPEDRKRFAELYYCAIEPEKTIIFHAGDIDGKERRENYVGPAEKHLLDAISSLNSEQVLDLEDKLKKIAEKSPYESVKELAKKKLESLN